MFILYKCVIKWLYSSVLIEVHLSCSAVSGSRIKDLFIYLFIYLYLCDLVSCWILC